MAYIGKCPYCENGTVNYEKKMVQGKNTKVFTCSNASWKTEDGEMFELTSTSTCNFRIWGNSLLKWGKRGIGTQEVRELLSGNDVVARLFSYKTKKEYFKYITLDKDYGISVLWDIDVEFDTIPSSNKI